MKTIISAILLTLAITLPVKAASEYKVPHIEGGTQMNARGRFGSTQFNFKMHVTGRTISELRLKAPQGVSLGQSINITDSAGRKVDSTIERQDQIVTISFAQPVTLGTELKFNLKDMETIDNSQMWHLETDGRLDGIRENIPLQTIRVAPYYQY